MKLLCNILFSKGHRLNDGQSEMYVVDKPFKISNISLDIDTIDDCSFRSVWVEIDGKHTLLGSVSYNTPQILSDIAFGDKEKLNFYFKGKSAMIYLCGYTIDDVVDDDDCKEVDQKKRKMSGIVIFYI